MKILLLKEVKGLGRAGDIKEASDGYAFNFLIPRRLARAVTANTTNVVLAQKAKQERLKKEFKKEREKLARKINSQTFSIIAKVDKNGTLYGGLDSKALAKELAKQKLNLSPDEIILPATIKKIGQYKVELKLGEEKVNINIEVKSE